MSQSKNIWPSQATKRLVPINQLIASPTGVNIPFDHLQIADLSSLQRETTLITYIGPTIKVLITKRAKLRVKVVCKMDGDDPHVKKYGAQSVLRTMSYAAGIVPVDPEQAQMLPSLTSFAWKLPDEVTWQFDLPAATTGAEVIQAVKRSDEYIQENTVNLLDGQTSS